MPSDQLVTVPGSGAAPQTYQIAAAQEIILKAAFCVFDGTGAASAWLPCLRILSPSGQVVGEYVTQNSIAAGSSAEVSWAPFLKASQSAPTPPPTPTGTLFAWWDFSDTTTITLDGSSNIQQITDKSGNGHTVSQGTASKRPSETTVNGLNAGVFARASLQQLDSTGWSPTLPQPFTIASVWTLDVAGSATKFPGVYGGLATPNPPILFVDETNTRIVSEQGVGSIITAGGGPFTQTLFTCLYRAGSSYLRVNGTQTNGSVDNVTATNLSLGTAHSPNSGGADAYLQGKICEILVYNGQLSTSQLAGTEAYLKAKWNTP